MGLNQNKKRNHKCIYYASLNQQEWQEFQFWKRHLHTSEVRAPGSSSQPQPYIVCLQVSATDPLSFPEPTSLAQPASVICNLPTINFGHLGFQGDGTAKPAGFRGVDWETNATLGVMPSCGTFFVMANWPRLVVWPGRGLSSVCGPLLRSSLWCVCCFTCLLFSNVIKYFIFLGYTNLFFQKQPQKLHLAQKSLETSF